MRPVIFMLLLACLIVGCGPDPNAPVYDTKANPDGFSGVALDLINDVEAGQLVEFDQIVARFADLYTGESALLDNEAWKSIIDRLGVKFLYRAQTALEQGVDSYQDAAGNFMLASFAHPDDLDLSRMSRLFATWSDRVNLDTTGQYGDLVSASLVERVNVLRQFELGDSLSRVFSKEFLRPIILGANGISEFTASQIGQLAKVDLCLLDYAGLVPYETSDFRASWGESLVSLVAAEVTETRPGWYLVELYFMADKRIDKDFTIALQAMTEDTLPSISGGELDFIPFDFSPVKATSQWTQGKIMATAKPIYFDQTLKRIRIGLYLRNTKDSQLKLSSSDETLYTFVINTETK